MLLAVTMGSSCFMIPKLDNIYVSFSFSYIFCSIYSSLIYFIPMWSIQTCSFPTHHILFSTLLANISISFSPKNQDIQDFFEWGLSKSLEFGHLYICHRHHFTAHTSYIVTENCFLTDNISCGCTDLPPHLSAVH